MKLKIFVAVCSMALALAGCNKKKIVASAPPAPPPTMAKSEPAPAPRRAVADSPAPARAVEPTPVAAPAKADTTFAESVDRQVKDVHFAYDTAAIGEEAGSVLASDATALKGIFQEFSNGKVVVEGNCDERGSAEYNLALGDRRAQTARDYLSKLGVPSSRLDVISYGKEKPVCTESDEACWAKNRRAHFTAAQ